MMAGLRDFFQGIENTVWDNKILLPWIAMAAATVLFVITQASLLFCVVGVALSGILTLVGVKFGDLYTIGKKMLTDAQTTTLPAVDKTLEDVNELLPKLRDVVDELEHPGQHLVEGVESVGAAVGGKASELLQGFMHILHRTNNPDAANDASTPAISSSATVKKKK